MAMAEATSETETEICAIVTVIGIFETLANHHPSAAILIAIGDAETETSTREIPEWDLDEVAPVPPRAISVTCAT